MMKNWLASLCVILGTSGTGAFAQIEKFIEVAVHETVENELESVSVQLRLYDLESQVNLLFESDEYGYEESMYDDYPDTYIDESLPAKERKRLEAEQAAAIEAWQQRVAEREALAAEERERKLAEVEFLTSQRAIEKLKANGFSVNIYGQQADDEYEVIPLSDTLMVIELKDSAAFVRLTSLFDNRLVQYSFNDLRYTKTVDKLQKVVPSLMEAADAQAKIIATASGKKIGSVAQITNVYPGFSPLIIERQMDTLSRMGSLLGQPGELANPFLEKEKQVVEYIFRYPILN
jgi:hypothetical protein